MFNGKRIKELEDRIIKLEREIYDTYNFGIKINGIRSEFKLTSKRLESENTKLKCIVAELCNYVYRDLK